MAAEECQGTLSGHRFGAIALGPCHLEAILCSLIPSIDMAQLGYLAKLRTILVHPYTQTKLCLGVRSRRFVSYTPPPPFSYVCTVQQILKLFPTSLQRIMPLYTSVCVHLYECVRVYLACDGWEQLEEDGEWNTYCTWQGPNSRAPSSGQARDGSFGVRRQRSSDADGKQMKAWASSSGDVVGDDGFDVGGEGVMGFPSHPSPRRAGTGGGGGAGGGGGKEGDHAASTVAGSGTNATEIKSFKEANGNRHGGSREDESGKRSTPPSKGGAVVLSPAEGRDPTSPSRKPPDQSSGRWSRKGGQSVGLGGKKRDNSVERSGLGQGASSRCEHARFFHSWCWRCVRCVCPPVFHTRRALLCFTGFCDFVLSVYRGYRVVSLLELAVSCVAPYASYPFQATRRLYTVDD